MINVLTGKNNKFTWIDLENPSGEELNDLASKYKLHYTSIQDYLFPDHLPKYEIIDNTVFIILRIYDDKTTKNAYTIKEVTRKLAIFCTDNYIITIHRSSQPFLHDFFDRLYIDPRSYSTDQIYMMLATKVLMSYQKALDILEGDLNDYEEQMLLKEIYNKCSIRDFFQLKRKASVYKKVMLLSKEVINRMSEYQKGPYLQDLKDTYVQMETGFERVVESAGQLMGMQISLSSQRTNEVMRILTIISVFFMPITFIVGVYGMNFSRIPELHWKYGYFIVWFIMIGITVINYIWFKRKKWI